MCFTVIQTVLFVQGLLQECFGQKAAYLFQQDKFYDVSYDLGWYCNQLLKRFFLDRDFGMS